MSDNESAPQAPNYTPLTNALNSQAQQEAQLAQQQQTWAQQQVAANQPTVNQAVSSDEAIAGNESDLATSINKQYQDTYQPLENKFAQEAQDYGSESNQELMAGRAGATAAQTDEQARQNTVQNLESFGIDPSSTRYAALDANMQLQKGADVAAAENNARVQTINTGLGLEQTAIGEGEVMPSMAAGANNVAEQGSAGAVNAGLAGTSTAASVLGTTPGYLAMENGSYGTYGNTLNTGYQNQLAQFQANQTAASGAGALAGSLVGGGGQLASGVGSIMNATKAAAPLVMFAAKGGAIPDIDDGDNDDIRPFVDHHFYVLHGFDDQGKRIEHFDAAMQHFFKTGNHVGTFNSPEEAHEHVQRQMYGKAKRMAVGGEVDGTEGGQVSQQLSPSRGAVTDDVPAVADGRQPIMLNAGEFIIPKDVTAWLGQRHFQQMIDKSRKDRSEAHAEPTTGQPPVASRRAVG